MQKIAGAGQDCRARNHARSHPLPTSVLKDRVFPSGIMSRCGDICEWNARIFLHTHIPWGSRSTRVHDGERRRPPLTNSVLCQKGKGGFSLPHCGLELGELRLQLAQFPLQHDRPLVELRDNVPRNLGPRFIRGLAVASARTQ